MSKEEMSNAQLQGVEYDRKPYFPSQDELDSLAAEIVKEVGMEKPTDEDKSNIGKFLREACIAIFHDKFHCKKVALVLFPTALTDYKCYAWDEPRSKWAYVGQADMFRG